MCQYPEVQRRAQEEIDKVTEGSRLPTIDDMHTLPYVHAIAKEVLRQVFLHYPVNHFHPYVNRTLSLAGIRSHRLVRQSLFCGG